jgi:hypothetical protein
MYKLLTIFFLLLSVTAFSQKPDKNWTPFKLVIIKADTAILDTSLYSSRDSMVIKQQKLYYEAIKNLEEQIGSTEGPKDSSMTRQLTNQLAYLKSMENEAKNFKCFHLLSSYSRAIYQFYFNENKPYSAIAEAPSQKTDLAGLAQLADTSKADYVVFFSNIHSATKNRLPVLKLTTSLYSKKDKKIIFSKETEGGADSRGEMWTCDDTVSCMFTNAVKSSTDEISAIIFKRQGVKKVSGAGFHGN